MRFLAILVLELSVDLHDRELFTSFLGSANPFAPTIAEPFWGDPYWSPFGPFGASFGEPRLRLWASFGDEWSGNRFAHKYNEEVVVGPDVEKLGLDIAANAAKVADSDDVRWVAQLPSFLA